MTLEEGIWKGEASVLMTPACCIGICPVPVTGLHWNHFHQGRSRFGSPRFQSPILEMPSYKSQNWEHIWTGKHPEDDPCGCV